ncbi:spore maturation protein B [uncultured Thomasclavelia sp.]|uniref:spore maturation protein B n=1 Tax=uncultured Thomasclavelia sp. TaxID=3025759 RepID=UPI0025FEC2F3|nr:spore maturation protein B [uncultured Thomasclavelia sp.]
MNSLILIILAIALIEAIIKKVDVFSKFLEGVKEGSKLLITLFPTMMAFILWVACFQNCGLLEILQNLLKPIIDYLKIPVEIIMMMIIRPFSSNGALALLNDIFINYGVDHPYSLLGSIIQTGSDTTFYVVTLYFGSIQLKNNRYALKLGLWLDFIACLLAVLFYLNFIK